MTKHLEKFYQFYEDLGDKRECWIEKESIFENSIASIHTEVDHVGAKPTYNKVCCCKLEQKQSDKKIEWMVVQQRWLKEELSIHGQDHLVDQPKKVWEICGSHLGSYSYFMYLNPTYELAIEGVAAEVDMDLGNDMISMSTPRETPVTELNFDESMESSLSKVPEGDEEEHTDEEVLPP